MFNDFLMETRHFIKNLCKQKVRVFFLSTLIAINVKWVPRLIVQNCHLLYVGCDNLNPKASKKFIISIVLIWSQTFRSQHEQFINCFKGKVKRNNAVINFFLSEPFCLSEHFVCTIKFQAQKCLKFRYQINLQAFINFFQFLEATFRREAFNRRRHLQDVHIFLCTPFL